jgi:preprotein translocase subunit YajC
LQFLIIIVLLLAVMWVLIIRPQKRRQLKQAQLLSTVAAGDEILTAGGIYGTVREVDEDELLVEIAPGTNVRFARRAIAGKVEPDEPDEPDDPEASDDAVDEAEAEPAEEQEEASVEPNRR